MIINHIPFKDVYLDEALAVVERGNAKLDGYSYYEADNYSKQEGGLLDIIDKALWMCLNNINSEYNRVWVESWINVVRNKPRQTYNRHSHVELNKERGKELPWFTWVYYLQIPDNLKGDEGKLEVEDSWSVHKYLPKVGDLVILKGDVWHSVYSAPNSSKDRVVIAGNMGVALDKQTKSLM